MLNKSIDIPIVLMVDEDEPLLYWIVHYKVKRGETVYDVAKKYDCYNNRDNVNEFISDIKKVNKLGGSKLKVGKHIVIPLRKYEITVESKEERLLLMYFVKILRNSVRKNPEAEYNGYRKYARVGPRSFEIVLQMDRNLAKLIDYENETFLGLKYVNVRTVNKDLVEVVFSNALLLDNDKKDILMNWLSTNPDGLKNCYVDYVSSNVVDVTSAVPAPKYLYEYEPLDVTCKYCGATFDHSRLIEFWDDDCNIWREKVCPSCGKDNCVDIAYESLSDVLKEIGLK